MFGPHHLLMFGCIIFKRLSKTDTNLGKIPNYNFSQDLKCDFETVFLLKDFLLNNF